MRWDNVGSDKCVDAKRSLREPGISHEHKLSNEVVFKFE